MILFVAGGMTYSEMRLAYTVGQALGKEIYIGDYTLLLRHFPVLMADQIRIHTCRHA